MKKRAIFLIFLMFLLGCIEQEYLTCPDGVSKVVDLDDCPEPTPECPLCNDNDDCTLDVCDATTGFNCTYREITPCDGNNLCESGEFPWSDDCPNTCEDNNACTSDSFNFATGKCMYTEIIPCCGNEKCEGGESFVGCNLDCEQVMDIKIETYEKLHSLAGSFEGDLIGTDSIYLLVEFKIHNMGIDRKEELNYKEQSGFYYDPFKFQLEDEHGGLYKAEYDSDLLENYQDIIVIPKGHIRGAALLFIIPKDSEHIRMVAYDKYGSKLDVAEIY